MPMKDAGLFVRYVPRYLIAGIFIFGLAFNSRDSMAADVTVPVPNTTNSNFYSRHNSFVAVAERGEVDLVFLGDSITAGWQFQGAPVFNSEYSTYPGAQFGIGGDRIENMLWRVLNGEFPAGFSPEVVVIHAGTNNFGTNTDAEIVAGTKNLAVEVQRRTGRQVLIVGLFPRPDANTFQNNRTNTINDALASWDVTNGASIRFTNIRSRFLLPSGARNDQLFQDAVHLTEQGYRAWADGIRATLNDMFSGPIESELAAPTGLIFSTP